MSTKLFIQIMTLILIALASVPSHSIANHHKREHSMIVNSWKNDISPRYQWDANNGYCGEVSLISAGLYYGQYASQYNVRSIACNNIPQEECQLLLGVNGLSAATQMHLNAVKWDSVLEQNTQQFLAWIKQNIVKSYPVIIGIYTNEYLFYSNTNPNAGQPDYDHIVVATGIDSNHSLQDPSYYGDDIVHFSDNGLWGNSQNPPYFFKYTFNNFQASRVEANAKTGPIYSLANDGTNYGLVVTGVTDLNGDTLPVRVETNVNNEMPAIVDGSNTRPTPMPIVLTITVSDLQPGVPYHLYKYSSFTNVPNSHFNASAGNAQKSWNIQISSGTTFVTQETINSDEVAVYRAVRASAP